MMSGCKTLIELYKGPAPKVSEVLLVECKDNQLLTKGDLVDLTDTLIVNSNRNLECKRKDNALIKQVRKLEEYHNK